MHSVLLTQTFLSDAKRAGLDDDGILEIATNISHFSLACSCPDCRPTTKESQTATKSTESLLKPISFPKMFQ